MPTTFFIADTHFGHKRMIMVDEQGRPNRPFKTVEEMDEHIIARWNATVNPTDTVYHLGDVCINRSSLSTIGRCNGIKKLVKGNHDVFRIEEYTEHFKDILAYKAFDDFVATHVPMHPDSLTRWGHNVHGHLHTYKVKRLKEKTHFALPDVFAIDNRYTCVSCEQVNYTPISLEQIRAML